MHSPGRPEKFRGRSASGEIRAGELSLFEHLPRFLASEDTGFKICFIGISASLAFHIADEGFDFAAVSELPGSPEGRWD